MKAATCWLHRQWLFMWQFILLSTFSSGKSVDFQDSIWSLAVLRLRVEINKCTYCTVQAEKMEDPL